MNGITRFKQIIYINVLIAASVAAMLVVPTMPAHAYTCPSDKHMHVNDAARMAVHHPWRDHKDDKCVSWHHHQFWVKAVTVKRMDSGRYQIRSYKNPDGSPHLSHILAHRPDDQYYYYFEIAPDGTLVYFKDNIHRGGFTVLILKALGIAHTAGPVIEALYKVPVDEWTDNDVQKVVKKWGEAVGRSFDGEWEGTAKAIALKIAAVVAADVRKSH